MNMQAMLKQAQKLQKDMMEAKNQIDETVYEGISSFVTVQVKGSKEIVGVKINQEQLEKEDIEILEDIIVTALNDAMKKIDKDTEEKMGKYTQGMPGLF